jgi:acetoin utilization deacetylase AcuC-like enzyme
MRLRVLYCDQHEIPLPCGHKFPIGKYRLLRERLAATGLFDLQLAPFATIEAIQLTHDSVYVQSFLDGSIAPAAMRRIGFPWSPGLVNRTLASVGSTLCSARTALECGIAGGLAGGTHHAFHSDGAGFCVFNDVAVAIRALEQERAISRAAIIDLDVHQGDGTAAIFSGDPNIFTFSMHGAKNFPFRKQPSVLDIELADGTGDGEYLDRLSKILPRIWEFRPDIIFFQAGVDPLATDRLGRLALTQRGLCERDRLVISQARDRAIPVVIMLGGGYSEPLEATVEAHANTFLIAAESRAPVLG